MVIDPNNIANTGNASTQSKAANAGAASGIKKSVSNTPNTAADAKDSVSLSQQGQSLGKVESAIAASPEVDQAKVDAIRTAIQSGQYRIDAESIADKMLSQDTLG
jgi:negative regulator of flagellin synthesis FlgM